MLLVYVLFASRKTSPGCSTGEHGVFQMVYCGSDTALPPTGGHSRPRACHPGKRPVKPPTRSDLLFHPAL